LTLKNILIVPEGRYHTEARYKTGAGQQSLLITANMLYELSDVWVQGMRTTDFMKKAALSFSSVELCIPRNSDLISRLSV
jgi:hypothetical protein